MATHEMCVLTCVKQSKTYHACRIFGGGCLHGLVDQHHLSPNLAMVRGENDLGMTDWLCCMERRQKKLLEATRKCSNAKIKYKE